MHFNYDNFQRLEIPKVYLTSQNKSSRVKLNVHNLHATLKLVDISEITFDIHEFEDGVKNEPYDLVEGLRTISIPEIGCFQLKQPEISYDGFKNVKSCVGRSLEYQLKQKYLTYFIINMGTTGSVDNVMLHNPDNPELSLLNLALRDVPNWSIGYIDPAIMYKQRSFEIDKQDVYSFLMNDVSQAYQCVFRFDTFNNKINVYAVDNLGKNTDIHISLKNLAKTIHVTSDEDAILTRIYVEGYDGLDIRSVNFGSDYIENLSYFNTPQWLGSQELYEKYNTYLEKLENQRENYINKQLEYETQLDVINELHNRLPENADSMNWAEYGLTELKTQQKSYQNIIDVQVEDGQDNPNHLKYDSYVLNLQVLNGIESEVAIREDEINSANALSTALLGEIQAIVNDVKEKNNFTTDEISILSTLKINSDYKDESYVVTDIMSAEDVINVKRELFATAKEELEKISQPQYYFKTEMCNLFAIPEFQEVSADFDIANFITLSVRDNYHIKLRLVTIDIDFEDIANFSVEFSNMIKSKNKANDFAYLLKKSVSSSVTSISRDLKEGEAKWKDALDEYVTRQDLEKDYLTAKGTKIYYTTLEDVKRATNLITGNQGGYKVDMLNEEGKPYETLYMDTDDINTATNVLRINKSGIGFSTTGYNGIYGTAITIDGHIVADYITTGVLNASLIKAGILKSVDETSWINMENGYFNLGNGRIVSDENGFSINFAGTDFEDIQSQITANATAIASRVTSGEFETYKTQTATSIDLKVSKGNVSSQLSVESGQVTINSNRLVVNSTNFSLTADGTLTAKNGTFTGTINSSNANITGGKITVNASSAYDNIVKLTYGQYSSSLRPYEFYVESNTIQTKIGLGGIWFTNKSTSQEAFLWYNSQASPPNWGLTIGNIEVQNHTDLDGSVWIGGDVTMAQGLSAKELYVDGKRHMVAVGSTFLNSSNEKTVSFGKTFPWEPKVMLTPYTNNTGVISGKVRNITTTGFTAIVGGSADESLFQWLAIL